MHKCMFRGYVKGQASSSLDVRRITHMKGDFTAARRLAGMWSSDGESCRRAVAVARWALSSLAGDGEPELQRVTRATM